MPIDSIDLCFSFMHVKCLLIPKHFNKRFVVKIKIIRLDWLGEFMDQDPGAICCLVCRVLIAAMFINVTDFR